MVTGSESALRREFAEAFIEYFGSIVASECDVERLAAQVLAAIPDENVRAELRVRIAARLTELEHAREGLDEVVTEALGVADLSDEPDGPDEDDPVERQLEIDVEAAALALAKYRASQALDTAGTASAITADTTGPATVESETPQASPITVVIQDVLGRLGRLVTNVPFVPGDDPARALIDWMMQVAEELTVEIEDMSWKHDASQAPTQAKTGGATTAAPATASTIIEITVAGTIKVTATGTNGS